jgi:hypothetical protein
VLPDALRAVVVLDAGLAAALDEPAAGAGFFPKKSVIDGWGVGFVFLAGLIYASLSSSLSPLLQGKKVKVQIKINYKEMIVVSTYDLRLMAWA